ncbi:MAG: DNA-binding protein [Oscillospiraceae bacterium]|nr:DNA-binding protein [Oscillospiraceae bacterium]
MKNQAYRMTMLYDFYGDMLTDRQKEFYDLYYNEDLSLAEIAENYGISRQGVRDVIVRAEATLTELEDKTGIIKRFHKMQEELAAMEDTVDGIAQLNSDKYQDNALEALCVQLKTALAALRQE